MKFFPQFFRIQCTVSAPPLLIFLRDKFRGHPIRHPANRNVTTQFNFIKVQRQIMWTHTEQKHVYQIIPVVDLDAFTVVFRLACRGILRLIHCWFLDREICENNLKTGGYSFDWRVRSDKTYCKWGDCSSFHNSTGGEIRCFHSFSTA